MKRCEVTIPHQPHRWGHSLRDSGDCPGVFDRPTLDEACERIAGFLAAFPRWEGMDYSRLEVPEPYRNGAKLLRSDLAALLAAVGWNVTAEQAREDTPPEQEALL